MARAKTARQIAASRKNIKKAQIASARKRRGTGKKRGPSGKKRSTSGKKRPAPGHKLKRSAARWQRAAQVAGTVAAISGFAYQYRRELSNVGSSIALAVYSRNARKNNPHRAAFTVNSSGVASVRSSFVPKANFSTGRALAVVTRGMNKKRRLRNQAADIASGRVKVVRRPVKLRMQAGY